MTKIKIGVEALPKEITPNPLLSSSIELKFVDKQDYDFLDKKLTKVFTSTLGLEKDEIISPENELALGFKSKSFYVLISSGFILFEHIKVYQKWERYSEFIKSVLNALIEVEFNVQLSRIGLRYINFFEEPVLPPLKQEFLSQKVMFGEVKNLHSFSSISFIKNDLKYLVQFGENIRIQTEENEPIGSVIDIDVSLSDNLPALHQKSLFDLIEREHIEGKEIFFSMINPEFLKTLEVKY